MEIFFLGTNASTPHKYRFLPSIVVRRKGKLFMFDCGEGTQYRFLRSGLGVNKDMKIFITHMHGDHYFGLPGLIQTFALLGRTKPLHIFGPRTLGDVLKNFLEKTGVRISYSLHFTPVEEGVIIEEKEYRIKAFLTSHTITNFAYIIEEKDRPGRFNRKKAEKLGIPRGRLWKKLQQGYPVKTLSGRIVRPEEVLGPPREGIKFVYSGDTRYSEKLIEFSQKADILIHDSTFENKLRDNAIDSGHSTASEAAEVARKARVRFLFLFHYSSRYSEDLINLLREAREIFHRAFLSTDGMNIEIKKPDSNKVILLFRKLKF
ncbi:MAG: ribonuclease Z [Thermoprotei archaeon]|nr:MAG: ribonuclease Z [Thermoprotei archaeon]